MDLFTFNLTLKQSNKSDQIWDTMEMEVLESFTTSVTNSRGTKDTECIGTDRINNFKINLRENWL
jgi:hypothetical protein